MARNFIVACCKLVSLLTKLSTLSQEIDLLYIMWAITCIHVHAYRRQQRQKGNTLKPYLPTKI